MNDARVVLAAELARRRASKDQIMEMDNQIRSGTAHVGIFDDDDERVVVMMDGKYLLVCDGGCAYPLDVPVSAMQ